MIWTSLWNSILKRLLRRGGVSMLSLSVALFLPTICQTISLFYYDVNIYNQLNFNISFSIKYYAWLQPIRGSLMARSDNTEKCFQRYFWIIDRCVLTLGSRKRSNICPRQWLYITLSHYFQWRHITVSDYSDLLSELRQRLFLSQRKHLPVRAGREAFWPYTWALSRCFFKVTKATLEVAGHGHWVSLSLSLKNPFFAIIGLSGLNYFHSLFTKYLTFKVEEDSGGDEKCRVTQLDNKEHNKCA